MTVEPTRQTRALDRRRPGTAGTTWGGATLPSGGAIACPSVAVWPLGTVTWVLLVSGMDYHKHHDRPFSEYCRRRRVDSTKGIHGEDPETALKRISPVLQLMTAGIILFHAIYPRSVEALKLLLQGSSTNPSLRFVPFEKAASIRPKC